MTSAAWGGSSKIIEYQEETKYLDPPALVDLETLKNDDPHYYLNRLNEIASPNERVYSLIKSLARIDQPTHESNLVSQVTIYSSIIGLFYGGFINSIPAQERFIRRHNHDVFQGQFLGLRRYKDTVIAECIGAGTRWAFKFGVVSAACTTFVMIPVAYRNEARFSDIVVSFGFLGAISRTWHGSKAMFVGTGLGFIGGALTYGALKFVELVSGNTIAENRYLTHLEWLKKRKDIAQKVRKLRQETLVKQFSQ